MAKDNINGVAYNTKTAETIAHNGSGKTINHSDERWFSETTGLSRSTVVIIMDTLKDAGRLTRVGSRKNGQWVLKG